MRLGRAVLMMRPLWRPRLKQTWQRAETSRHGQGHIASGARLSLQLKMAAEEFTPAIRHFGRWQRVRLGTGWHTMHCAG